MDGGALALAPVIVGVAVGASALTFLAFWAYDQRQEDARRRALAVAVVVVGALAYGAYVFGALIAPRIMAVSERTITSPEWRGPPLRIAVLANPRLGPRGMQTQELQRLIARINANSPDLVLVVGDLTDHGLAAASMEERFGVTLALGALARLEAGLGVAAVLGPNDVAYGRETVSRDLEEAGVAVLWNRAVLVERVGVPFAIAGWAPTIEADPEMAREGAEAGAPIIAVASSPGSTPGAHPAALTIIASQSCGGLFGCDRPVGVEGPFVGTAGLAGGALTPPSVVIVTLRAADPN